MALVKYGGGIIQMSGSIAGNTYARNHFGNYVRARTKPVNPDTHLQQVVRAALAFLADRWAQTLTAPQRAAWELYGSNVAMKNRLGETVFMTGFNHYIRSNMIRKQANRAVIDAGPVVFELPAQDPSFNIACDETNQEITYNFDIGMDWSTEDGSYIFLFQGRPQNAQRNFFKGPWRLRGDEPGVDPGGATTPEVRASAWGIAELQHVWGYARISRADGRLSEPFQDDTFCVA